MAGLKISPNKFLSAPRVQVKIFEPSPPESCTCKNLMPDGTCCYRTLYNKLSRPVRCIKHLCPAYRPPEDEK